MDGICKTSELFVFSHLKHLATAKNSFNDPEDQKYIPHPRIGFYGVLDEGFDIQLFEQMADLKSNYSFILIAPAVVQIDQVSLPRRKNIYYLGKKDEKDLPRYLSGWDYAIMPFSLNKERKSKERTNEKNYIVLKEVQ